MLYAFILSSAVLVLVLVSAYLEATRGVRFGGNVRRIVDRRCARSWVALRHGGKSLVDAVHRDVFIKFLHLLSYVALVLVRKAEHRLERLTTFFRTFRKRTRSQVHHGTRENSSGDTVE